MKGILEHLFSHGKLSFAEAKSVMLDIPAEKYDNVQVIAFVTCFNMRPINTQELAGFRVALFEKYIRVDLGNTECMDIVGTGGDGKDTYNISTLSAVVMAGAGVKVAKHGSYSASSVCGSSNVLQHLGYEFLKNSDALRSQLDKNNLCFLHAPYFHPTLKSTVPVRKSLKEKSCFNILRPLVHHGKRIFNPYGVYDNVLSRVYQSILCKQDRKFAVVYNLDGYDEISLTGKFLVRSNEATQTYSPADLDMPMYHALDLFGGQDVESNAQVFINVLEDEVTEAQKNVVIANFGYAIGLSVLTDEQFFGGSLNDLQDARAKNNTPILLKDFVIDSYQIYEAKSIGAGDILLIAKILSKSQLNDLADEAKSLGLEFLMEIHSEQQLEKYCSQVDIIGVNNRNLETFEISIQNSINNSYDSIPDEVVKISESGISKVENILKLRDVGFKGFLIGEHFMAPSNLGKKCKSFVNEINTSRIKNIVNP